jgi:hypothetical protein
VASDARRFVTDRSRALPARAGQLLEWPLGIARLGVIACIAVAISFVLVKWVQVLDQLDARADKHAALTYEDREIGVGNSIVADQRAMFEARALIPPDAKFWVVTGGGNVGEATELTNVSIPNFATYFLMPRRPSDSAPWVICYGCDIAALSGNPRVVWSNGAGISIVRRDVTSSS